MAESLGRVLKTLRESAGLTLRDVESKTHVSNGYLSLLENDKVKAPSPKALFDLAKAFEIDYMELMRLAGYPIPTSQNTPQLSVVFRGAERLSQDEQQEIQDIINLKLKKKREKE